MMSLRKRRSRRTKKVEGEAADALGARRLAASGAMPYGGQSSAGGDLLHAKALIEHKRTETATLSVKADWFDKVEKHASLRGKIPVLVICFDGPEKIEMAFFPLRYAQDRLPVPDRGLKMDGIESRRDCRSLTLTRVWVSSLLRAAREANEVLGLVMLPAEDNERSVWMGVSMEDARRLLDGE